jgi:hypothetical protein
VAKGEFCLFCFFVVVGKGFVVVGGRCFGGCGVLVNGLGVWCIC